MDVLHAQPLMETLVPPDSDAPARVTLGVRLCALTNALGASRRKVGLGMVVFASMSVAIISVADHSHVGRLHAIGMIETNASDVNSTGSWQVPKIGFKRVARFVIDPEDMYESCGMVSMPVAYLNVKGFGNFAVQIVFFFGSTICLGRSAMELKMNEKTRFSKLSIAFQVVGLLGAANGIKSIAMAAQPWQGTAEFLLFCLLDSQHSSTITVVTGLANNIFILATLQPDDSISHDERRWAKWLVISGMIIGIPVWVSILVAFPYVSIGIGGAVVGLRLTLAGSFYKVFEDTWIAVERAKEDQSHLMTVLFVLMCWTFFILVSLHVFWVLMALTQVHMWLMLAAFVCEFLVPLVGVALLLKWASFSKGVLPCMFISFAVAMCVSYVVTTCVPASILYYTSEVGYMGAAPAAFWGKKINTYAWDTFAVPGEHAQDALQLWWSQIAGFFS